MTFYGWLHLSPIHQASLTVYCNLDFVGVRPNANQDELNKAYRKKSKLLHPDKVKRAFVANTSKDQAKSRSGASTSPSKRKVDATVKEAHERSARLNTVATILRGPGRDRYDYFLKNGFPKWKGTGYYYSRFRPGLGSVLIGLLLVFGGGAHYAALVLGWKRQREFVDRYIRQARRAAWGDDSAFLGIPGLDEVDTSSSSALPPAESDSGSVSINRRQKRMMDKESKKEGRKGTKTSSRSASTPANPPATQPTGERKRVVAENGKVLIVDSTGDVFLEEDFEGERQEFLLDVNELQRPTIRDTLLFRLPVWCFRKTLGGLLTPSAAPVTEDSDSTPKEEEPSEVVDQTEGSNGSVAKSNRGKRKGKRTQKS